MDEVVKISIADIQVKSRLRELDLEKVEGLKNNIEALGLMQPIMVEKRKNSIQNYSLVAGAHIECLPYADVIRRYDRPGTLFYLDPPYWGNENDYGKDLFSRADFALLAVVLSTISGRFIMSLNDRPEVRETFQRFDIEAVKTAYTIAAKSAKKVGEVIISN